MELNRNLTQREGKMEVMDFRRGWRDAESVVWQSNLVKFVMGGGWRSGEDLTYSCY